MKTLFRVRRLWTVRVHVTNRRWRNKGLFDNREDARRYQELLREKHNETRVVPAKER
jgi:hypothetical protein